MLFNVYPVFTAETLAQLTHVYLEQLDSVIREEFVAQQLDPEKSYRYHILEHRFEEMTLEEVAAFDFEVPEDMDLDEDEEFVFP